MGREVSDRTTAIRVMTDCPPLPGFCSLSFCHFVLSPASRSSTHAIFPLLPGGCTSIEIYGKRSFSTCTYTGLLPIHLSLSLILLDFSRLPACDFLGCNTWCDGFWFAPGSATPTSTRSRAASRSLSDTGRTKWSFLLQTREWESLVRRSYCPGLVRFQRG